VFFTALAARPKEGGELLAAENVAGGPVLNCLRRDCRSLPLGRRGRCRVWEVERLHGLTLVEAAMAAARRS
jgi:hypothetical protein